MLVTMPTTQEVGSGVVWVKASDSVLYRHPGSACGVSAGSHGLERHEQWLVVPYSRHPPSVGSAGIRGSGAAQVVVDGVHCAADGSGSSVILHCSASSAAQAGSGWWLHIQDIPHVLVVLVFMIMGQPK